MKLIKNFFLETYIVLTVFFLILAFSHLTLFNNFYFSCLFTVVFSIFTCIILIAVNKIHLFSFPIIFLAVTFLFTCSTPVLFLFYDMKAFVQWKFIDLNETNESLIFLNILFSSFYVGASLFKKEQAKTLYTSNPLSFPLPENSDPGELLNLKRIGFILLILSVMFVIISTLQGKGLVYFIQYSYSAYHQDRTEGEIDIFYKLTFSNFIPWGLILIMLGAKNLRQFRIYILFFVLPFVLIIFLTGDRSSAFPMLMLLFSIFYIKFHTTTKIPWRKILIIGFIAIYLVPVLRVTRTIPIKDWNTELLIDVFTFKTTNYNIRASEDMGVLTSTLYATSNTLQTLVGTTKIVPEKMSYRYGFDYVVRPVIIATPFYDFFINFKNGERSNNISSSPSSWFNYNYSPKGTGLGFLQVSEAYLNFGPFGVMVFYLLAGYLLTRFWFNALTFNNGNRKITIKQLALWLLFFNSVIIWIRNDAAGQLRSLTWSWLIVYGGIYVIDIFKSKKIKKHYV